MLIGSEFYLFLAEYLSSMGKDCLLVITFESEPKIRDRGFPVHLPSRPKTETKLRQPSVEP